MFILLLMQRILSFICSYYTTLGYLLFGLRFVGVFCSIIKSAIAWTISTIRALYQRYKDAATTTQHQVQISERDYSFERFLSVPVYITTVEETLADADEIVLMDNPNVSYMWRKDVRIEEKNVNSLDDHIPKADDIIKAIPIKESRKSDGKCMRNISGRPCDSTTNVIDEPWFYNGIDCAYNVRLAQGNYESTAFKVNTANHSSMPVEQIEAPVATHPANCVVCSVLNQYLLLPAAETNVAPMTRSIQCANKLEAKVEDENLVKQNYYSKSKHAKYVNLQLPTDSACKRSYKSDENINEALTSKCVSKISVCSANTPKCVATQISFLSCDSEKSSEADTLSYVSTQETNDMNLRILQSNGISSIDSKLNTQISALKLLTEEIKKCTCNFKLMQEMHYNKSDTLPCHSAVETESTSAKSSCNDIKSGIVQQEKGTLMNVALNNDKSATRLTRLNEQKTTHIDFSIKDKRFPNVHERLCQTNAAIDELASSFNKAQHDSLGDWKPLDSKVQLQRRMENLEKLLKETYCEIYKLEPKPSKCSFESTKNEFIRDDGKNSNACSLLNLIFSESAIVPNNNVIIVMQMESDELKQTKRRRCRNQLTPENGVSAGSSPTTLDTADQRNYSESAAQTSDATNSSPQKTILPEETSSKSSCECCSITIFEKAPQEDFINSNEQKFVEAEFLLRKAKRAQPNADDEESQKPSKYFETKFSQLDLLLNHDNVGNEMKNEKESSNSHSNSQQKLNPIQSRVVDGRQDRNSKQQKNFDFRKRNQQSCCIAYKQGNINESQRKDFPKAQHPRSEVENENEPRKYRPSTSSACPRRSLEKSLVESKKDRQKPARTNSPTHLDQNEGPPRNRLLSAKEEYCIVDSQCSNDYEKSTKQKYGAAEQQNSTTPRYMNEENRTQKTNIDQIKRIERICSISNCPMNKNGAEQQNDNKKQRDSKFPRPEVENVNEPRKSTTQRTSSYSRRSSENSPVQNKGSRQKLDRENSPTYLDSHEKSIEKNEQYGNDEYCIADPKCSNNYQESTKQVQCDCRSTSDIILTEHENQGVKYRRGDSQSQEEYTTRARRNTNSMNGENRTQNENTDRIIEAQRVCSESNCLAYSTDTGRLDFPTNSDANGNQIRKKLHSSIEEYCITDPKCTTVQQESTKQKKQAAEQKRSLLEQNSRKTRVCSNYMNEENRTQNEKIDRVRQIEKNCSQSNCPLNKNSTERQNYSKNRRDSQSPRPEIENENEPRKSMTNRTSSYSRRSSETSPVENIEGGQKSERVNSPTYLDSQETPLQKNEQYKNGEYCIADSKYPNNYQESTKRIQRDCRSTPDIILTEHENQGAKCRVCESQRPILKKHPTRARRNTNCMNGEYRTQNENNDRITEAVRFCSENNCPIYIDNIKQMDSTRNQMHHQLPRQKVENADKPRKPMVSRDSAYPPLCLGNSRVENRDVREKPERLDSPTRLDSHRTPIQKNPQYENHKNDVGRKYPKNGEESTNRTQHIFENTSDIGLTKQEDQELRKENSTRARRITNSMNGESRTQNEKMDKITEADRFCSESNCPTYNEGTQRKDSTKNQMVTKTSALSLENSRVKNGDVTEKTEKVNSPASLGLRGSPIQYNQQGPSKENEIVDPQYLRSSVNSSKKEKQIPATRNRTSDAQKASHSQSLEDDGIETEFRTTQLRESRRCSNPNCQDILDKNTNESDMEKGKRSSSPNTNSAPKMSQMQRQRSVDESKRQLAKEVNQTTTVTKVAPQKGQRKTLDSSPKGSDNKKPNSEQILETTNLQRDYSNTHIDGEAVYSPDQSINANKPVKNASNSNNLNNQTTREERNKTNSNDRFEEPSLEDKCEQVTPQHLVPTTNEKFDEEAAVHRSVSDCWEKELSDYSDDEIKCCDDSQCSVCFYYNELKQTRDNTEEADDTDMMQEQCCECLSEINAQSSENCTILYPKEESERRPN